ncbi:MAG TPA: hypothetical protein VJZ00_10315, partial [Thermoanaerobaculia bacterium]|nr:hypothetical protein [Thermoanaerobaculia bacterium]
SAAAVRGEELANEIADRSIQILRDQSNLLPITKQAKTFIVTDQPEPNPLTELAAPMIDDTTQPFDIEADVLLLLLALRPKSGAGRIKVPEAARRLAEKHAKHTVAVSFGSPYVLRELGEISTFVCAWGIQPVMQRAAMKVLQRRM